MAHKFVRSSIRRLLAFTLAALIAISLGHWSTAQAQTPTTPQNSSNLIDIQFNPETDGNFYIPEGLESDTRAVIGTDDRIPLTESAFPWSTIGRLYWVLADGTQLGQCTGTLVGRDVVLTNSHCLAHPTSGTTVSPIAYRAMQDRLVFVPNMIEGNFVPEDVAIVTDNYSYGWSTNPGSPQHDWALLKLSKPLGETYGYLGWRSLDFSNPAVLSTVQSTVSLAGYSGDFPNRLTRLRLRLGGIEGETAGRHQRCSINGLVEGVIGHNCDTMGGASGSALFARFTDEKYYIVGLHRGSFDLPAETLPAGQSQTCRRYGRGTSSIITVPACTNVAVPVSRWSVQATAMRNLTSVQIP